MAQGRKTGGRKKGTPNKTTAKAKEVFATAFEELGGLRRLVQWANKDDENYKAFLMHFAKLIPLTHEGGDPDKPIKISFKE